MSSGGRDVFESMKGQKKVSQSVGGAPIRCSVNTSPDEEWGRAGVHCTLQADLGKHVLILAVTKQSRAETHDSSYRQ